MTSTKSLAFPLEPFIYGLATISSVWAMGGGNNDLLWSRSLALGLVLSILGAGSLVAAGQWPLFKNEKINYKIAFASATATALPFVFGIYFLLNTHFFSIGVPYPDTIVKILPFAILVSFGSEIIYRKFLFTAWGLSTAAFVEALTLGFGSHFFFLFLIFFIMGHAWATMLPRYGLKTIILSRMLWTFIIFSSAYLFA